MKTGTKVLIVTLLVGVPAFLLGPVIWPSPEGGEGPTSGQLPFFIFLGVMEAVGLGLGVAFVIFGWPLILWNASGPSKARALLMCLSITWLLVSWWPHDNLHRYIGDDLQALLYLEYGFHLTLIVCGIILAYSLVRYDPVLKEIRERTGAVS